MAAAVDHLTEELFRLDAHFVHGVTGNVVTRGGIGVDQGYVLAFEIFDFLVRRVGLHVKHRVVAFDAALVHFDGKGRSLDANHASTGIRGRSVVRDMDLLGALAFDHGGVVTGNTQLDRYADLAGQVRDEVTIALGHHGSVFIRNAGKHQLRVFGFPVLGLGRSHQGAGGGECEEYAAIEHENSFYEVGGREERTRTGEPGTNTPINVPMRPWQRAAPRLAGRHAALRRPVPQAPQSRTAH